MILALFASDSAIAFAIFIVTASFSTRLVPATASYTMGKAKACTCVYMYLTMWYVT